MNPFRFAVLAALPAAIFLPALTAPAQSSIDLNIVVGQGTHTRIEINNGTIPGSSLPESSNPDHITAFGNKVLFRAYLGQARGHELWISDGTPGGTNQFVDLESGADDVRGHIAVLNGRAFFSARSPGDGIELWVTDGTTTQLFMNLDGGPGDSYPEYLTRIGQRIFFAAEDAEGAEPWVTDGTVAGTRRLMNINTEPDFLPSRIDSGSKPKYFAGEANAVVFQADDGILGRELWFTDGNNDTRLLKDIYLGEVGGDLGSVPENMTSAHPTLATERYVVFSADTTVDVRGIPQRYRLPWVTDFTPEGTHPLFSTYNVIPSDFVSWGHGVWFAGWIIDSSPSTPSAGWGIWSTDGTQQGTRPRFTKIGGSGLSKNMHLTMAGDRRLYMASDVRVPTTTSTELVSIELGNLLGFTLYELDPDGGSLPENWGEQHGILGSRGDRKPFAVAGDKVFMAASKFDRSLFRSDTELVVVDNHGTSKLEDWGCGDVWLRATDPVIDPILAPSTVTFIGNSTLPGLVVNQVIVGLPAPPAPLASLFGPFPGITFAGCQFYLDPSKPMIFLPPSTGNWYSNIENIPTGPAWIGMEFMAQMITGSTLPTPTVQMSNPVRMVIGN